MLKRLWAVCIVIAVLASFFTPAVSAAEPICLYVHDSFGNDGNTGITLVQAFKTIGKAKETVAAIISNGLMNSDIIVYIRAGDYFIDNTINFRAEDSGKNGFTVHYAGYPGDDMPRIIGGQRVTGWTLDANGIYKANVSGWANKFNRLYETVNGESKPAVMARWPKRINGAGNGTFAKTASESVSNRNTQFKITADDYNNYFIGADLRYAQVYIMPGETHCYDTLIPVTGFDPSTRTVTIQSGVLAISNPSNGYYFIQGVKQFLTDPGEFYLDKGTMTLYYKPLNPVSSASELNGIEIIAPKVKRLFDFNGASYISLEGLQLEATDCSDAMGTFQGDGAPYLPSGGLVYLVSSSNITIDGCNLYNAGESAVYSHSRSYAKNDHFDIVNNHMKNIGYSAINMALGGSSYFNIINNLIENVGITDGYSDALTNQGNNNIKFEHNKIVGSAGQGVSLRYDVTNNSVSYNEFIDCLQYTHDMGVIYLWHTSGRGAVIRNNYIHDCGSKYVPYSGQKIHAIYLDELVDNILIENNIIADMKAFGDVMPLVFKGKYNIIRNNICYQASKSTVDGGISVAYTHDLGSYGTISDLTVEKNIFYLSGGGMYNIWNWESRNKGYAWNTNTFAKIDNNLYYFPGGYYNVWYNGSDHDPYTPIPYAPDTTFNFTQWQQYGTNRTGANAGVPFDEHSITGQNPLFTDPTNGDFSLRDGSPAKGLGFNEIKQSEIGPDRFSRFFITSKISGITLRNIQKTDEGGAVSIKGDIINATGKSVLIYLAKYKGGKLTELDSDLAEGTDSFSVALPKCQAGEKMKLMIWTGSMNPVIDYILIN